MFLSCSVPVIFHGIMAGGKTNRIAGIFATQLAVIRPSVFSAILILPQLFRTKSLHFFVHRVTLGFGDIVLL